MDIDTGRLRSLVESIEGIEADIRDRLADRREVYVRAKADGFDPKVIRALIRERRSDQRELELFQDQLSLYRKALGQ